MKDVYTRDLLVKSFLPLILVALILCVSLPSSGEEDPKPLLSKQALSSEQIEIYRTFLHGFVGEGNHTLHLSNRTHPLSRHTSPDCLRDIELANLAEAQSTVHVVGSKVVYGKKVRLVDPQRYVVNFDRGILHLSEIAFSKDRRLAVLSYSYYCGPLCGRGETMMFQKAANGWKKAGSCRAWLSGQPIFRKDQGL